MKNFHLGLLLFIGWCLAAPSWADPDPYVEGVQFEKLENPQPTSEPGKVEVLEAFWYGCPHCYDLEPNVSKWLETKPDDVNFLRFPAIPSDRWEWYAKAFYAAQSLEVSDKIHAALFKAIHDERKKLKTPDEMASFFAEHGVKKEDFIATLNSFAVHTKINQARQVTRRYGLASVPTIIINGKYRTSGSMAGTGEDIFLVVDYLIDKERSTLPNTAEANP